MGQAAAFRSKRWQDDPAFVGWLCREQYAQTVDGLEVKPYLSLGAMLYLYEAWRAGAANERAAPLLREGETKLRSDR